MSEPANEITPISSNQVAAITPMAMLQMAVSQNADLEKLERLMALQERYEANEAKKAFNLAVSRFKAHAITVSKDGYVSFTNSKNEVTAYSHAKLSSICNAINPALSENGLSYRWETAREGDKIKVTCILSHKMGHSASVTLEAGADSSGGKNNIQAIGSTVSYLQRYTLLAITGTATEEMDDDGRGSQSQDDDSGNAGSKGGKTGPSLPDCTAEKFDSMCVDTIGADGVIQKMGWKTLVKSGTKTADHLIVMLQKKFTLSKEQIETIQGWAK